MSESITSFAEIIELWPSAVEYARDVAVKDVTARAFKARGIPAEYWVDTVEAARRRGFGQVTLDLLARLAAQRAGRRQSLSAALEAAP